MRVRTTIVTGFEGQSAGPAWQQPAPTWFEAIERYIAFIQVPAWRARAPHEDGREPKACSTTAEAVSLRQDMLRLVQAMALRRRRKAIPPRRRDLAELLTYVGSDVPKADRCSRRVHWHLQRALLLNEGGYTCVYCGRSAWGVWAEKTGKEPARTLRFEVDHRITRRRLTDRERFDPKNLVIACLPFLQYGESRDDGGAIHDQAAFSGPSCNGEQIAAGPRALTRAFTSEPVHSTTW